MGAPSPSMEAGPSGAIDGRRFRQVLGHFPTGVVVITAKGGDERHFGMAVGSFTSVSLDPPLVAFLPDRKSTSFPKIRETGSFCVNVLTADQEHVCRAFASKAEDKFADINWHAAPFSGAPIIDDAVAWIDCDIEVVHEAGDHYIVVGRVRELNVDSSSLPLLFFQGGYGRFAPSSLAAPAEADLLVHLQLVDIARPFMERVATELEVECLAAARVQTDMVIVASAGEPHGRSVQTRVGQRIPFLPPLGAPFVAWEGQDQIDAWLAPLRQRGNPAEVEGFRTAVDRVRERGWSLGLGSETHKELEHSLARLPLRSASREQEEAIRRSIDRLGSDYEPADLQPGCTNPVRNLSVPVFGPTGSVVLLLSVYGLPHYSSPEDVERYRDSLSRAADTVTERLGGQRPPAG